MKKITRAHNVLQNVGHHGLTTKKIFKLKSLKMGKKVLIFVEMGNVSSQHKSIFVKELFRANSQGLSNNQLSKSKTIKAK